MFAIVSLFPRSGQVVDVRSLRPHEIDMEVSKPPLAAMADLYYEYDPAHKSADVQVTLAQARSLKLEPTVLDVTEIVKEESSRILAQQYQEVAQPVPPVEVGFSRRKVVASPHQAETRALNHFLTSPSPVPPKAQSIKMEPAGKTIGQLYGPKEMKREATAAKEGETTVTSYETAQGFRDYAREILGKLEFRPGLAMTSGTDQLVVYRQHLGERLDQGHVFYDRGEFAIYVQELRGELVAELRDMRGQVLGRGALSLDKIFTDQRQVKNLSLYLEPLRAGFTGQIYDLAQFFKSGHRSAVADARVDYLGFADFIRTMPDGSYMDIDVVEGSQTLVQVSKEGYIATIGYAQESLPQNLPLLKHEYFEELFPVATLSRQKNPAETGYILGRVMMDGSSKAGAKVSLIDGIKARPIYLNEEGRPTRRQDQTDASGYFLLPDVPPGLSGVRVGLASSSESKVIPVGQAALTYIEVDMSSSVDVEVTYRSFPGDALTPMVTRSLASEDLRDPPLDVRGGLKVSPGPDPLFIVADGDESLEPMTYTALRESSSLELPVLKSEWVNSLYSQTGKARGEFTGQILGWIGARSSFVVDLDHLDGETQNADVIYLDPRGEILRGATEGVVGGSFILLNVSEGLRRVRVYYSSGEYSSCVAYLEAGTTAACAY